MDEIHTDQLFMQKALHISKNALPNCLPNPPVGCILVQNNQIIAQGFTQPPYHEHAEAMALNYLKSISAVKEYISDAPITAYVTLEPCSFQGKTPSCAKSLIASNITRVVIAILDPDPRNNGKGLALIENAGIQTKLGVLQAETNDFLLPFLSSRVTPH
jgi:pyrimidine deaminase RibD-like protein